MSCWNVTKHSNKAMSEAMDRWNVAENSGAANGNQDAEAKESWKDVERVGAKKGQRMHRGVQRAIDRWKSKKKESMDCWDVAENSGAANGHQDAEAK